jgi:zinc-binding alcohol dehydrogenase/oxidoreductase
MKAIVLKSLNHLSIEEVPIPEPAAAEVLIRVRASALNHRDVWIMKGLYANIQLPVTLGSDGAGMVVKCGEGVEEKWLGREVMINPCLNWGDNPRAQQKQFRILGMPDNGAQAEYVCVPAVNIVDKPKYLSFEEASAIPLGGLTGYRALFLKGKVQQKQIVLITGIGGGVATLMMKMALAVGANVLVTSSKDDKIDKAIKEGVIGGVNYLNKNWTDTIRRLADEEEIDLIVDSAGGKGFLNLIELLKPGGRLVFFGATAGNVPELNLRRIFWKQLTIQGTTMGSPQDFNDMLDFFSLHKIQPIIDQVIPIKDYQKAYERMITGQQFGKIVIRHSD